MKLTSYCTSNKNRLKDDCSAKTDDLDRGEDSQPHQVFSHHRMFFSNCNLCNLQTFFFFFPTSTFKHYTQPRGVVTAFLQRWGDFLVTNKLIMRTHSKTRTKNWLLLKLVHKEITHKTLGAVLLQHQGACCVVMLQAKCNEAVMCGLLCHLCLMTAQRCQCIQTMNWEVKWMWWSWRTQLFIHSFI